MTRASVWQVELRGCAVLLPESRATVLCIGVTTIAAAIGAGGLVVFIFRGFSMVNNQVILAGAIPAALLAVCRHCSWRPPVEDGETVRQRC